MASKATIERFDELLAQATNDEVVEFTIRLFEELGERADNASFVASRSGDRDAVSEAATFAHTAAGFLPFSPDFDRIVAAKTLCRSATRRMERVVLERGQQEPDEERPAVVTRGGAWHRQADRQREAERAATAKVVAALDLSEQSVLRALEAAAENGPAAAKDVAVAIAGQFADTQAVGRQRVINTVGQVLRKLAETGAVSQIRPVDSSDGRATCRYTVAEGDDDDA